MRFEFVGFDETRLTTHSGNAKITNSAKTKPRMFLTNSAWVRLNLLATEIRSQILQSTSECQSLVSQNPQLIWLKSQWHEGGTSWGRSFACFMRYLPTNTKGTPMELCPIGTTSVDKWS